MISKQQLDHLRSALKKKYNSLNSWAHGWPHIESVECTSHQLAEIEGANPLVCSLSAYCHDLGRIDEEKTGIDRGLGSHKHTRLSERLTIELLNSLGIGGDLSSVVVEAVSVHSDKIYTGKNIIARILRDADKKDGLGSLGLLRNTNFHLGRDFLDTSLILKNLHNPAQIRKIADRTLYLISQYPLLIKPSLEILDFTLEWSEKGMFETSQAHSLFKEDINYSENARKFLSSL